MHLHYEDSKLFLADDNQETDPKAILLIQLADKNSLMTCKADIL